MPQAKSTSLSASVYACFDIVPKLLSAKILKSLLHFVLLKCRWISFILKKNTINVDIQTNCANLITKCSQVLSRPLFEVYKSLKVCVASEDYINQWHIEALLYLMRILVALFIWQ